jgi:uncharacterized membrane protein
MLWIKALHIFKAFVFIASWFAGLFYLPRIFVNLARKPTEVLARLLGMARKLYRFSMLASGPAAVRRSGYGWASASRAAGCTPSWRSWCW